MSSLNHEHIDFTSFYFQSQSELAKVAYTMIKDAWGKHTGLQASYKAAGTVQCVKQKALHRVTTLMVGLLGHL